MEFQRKRKEFLKEEDNLISLKRSFLILMNMVLLFVRVTVAQVWCKQMIQKEPKFTRDLERAWRIARSMDKKWNKTEYGVIELFKHQNNKI